MAVTAAPIKSFDIADGQKVIVDITGPASYTSGGEPDAPIKALMRVGQLQSVSGSGVGYLVSYDAAAETILFHRAGTADAVLNEVTAAVDLSAVVVRCECVGR